VFDAGTFEFALLIAVLNSLPLLNRNFGAGMFLDEQTEEKIKFIKELLSICKRTNLRVNGGVDILGVGLQFGVDQESKTAAEIQLQEELASLVNQKFPRRDKEIPTRADILEAGFLTQSPDKLLVHNKEKAILELYAVGGEPNEPYGVLTYLNQYRYSWRCLGDLKSNQQVQKRTFRILANELQAGPKESGNAHRPLVDAIFDKILDQDSILEMDLVKALTSLGLWGGCWNSIRYGSVPTTLFGYRTTTIDVAAAALSAFFQGGQRRAVWATDKEHMTGVPLKVGHLDHGRMQGRYISRKGNELVVYAAENAFAWATNVSWGGGFSPENKKVSLHDWIVALFFITRICTQLFSSCIHNCCASRY
jgi:hypothetical protein